MYECIYNLIDEIAGVDTQKRFESIVRFFDHPNDSFVREKHDDSIWDDPTQMWGHPSVQTSRALLSRDL